MKWPMLYGPYVRRRCSSFHPTQMLEVNRTSDCNLWQNLRISHEHKHWLVVKTSGKGHIRAGGGSASSWRHLARLVINIWVTHNYLFMAASYSVVQTGQGPLNSSQQSTFTMADTPQNTDPALCSLWAKTGGKRK